MHKMCKILLQVRAAARPDGLSACACCLTWRGYPTCVGKLVWENLFSSDSVAVWRKLSFLPLFFSNPPLDASSAYKHIKVYTEFTLYDKSHVGCVFMRLLFTLIWMCCTPLVFTVVRMTDGFCLKGPKTKKKKLYFDVKLFKNTVASAVYGSQEISL